MGSEVVPSEKTRRMLFSPFSFCLASLTILATTTLACGPLSAPSGSSFCATQSCSHIYNFQPWLCHGPPQLRHVRLLLQPSARSDRAVVQPRQVHRGCAHAFQEA